MSEPGSDERPDWPRFRTWSELAKWKRYFLLGVGGVLLVLIGFLAGTEIQRTGRVWPSVRYLLLCLPILAALVLVIGFYKVRRVGATLLSAAGLVAMLSAIWWAVPAERGLVLTVGEMTIEMTAASLVFVPAVTRRMPTAAGFACGLLGLLYGIGWAVPALPGPARNFVDAGIEGVFLGGISGLLLIVAERAGLLTFPWRDEDADARRASTG